MSIWSVVLVASMVATKDVSTYSGDFPDLANFRSSSVPGKPIEDSAATDMEPQLDAPRIDLF